MSLTRLVDTDDSGSGLDGTPHNNAWLQALQDVIDARWSRTTITTTGTQTVISFSEADLLLCNNATDLTIRSLTAPSPAKPAKRLVIVSIGAGHVFLNHQDTSGTTAANRMINFATSGTTPLAAGSGAAVYVYDDNASRWRLNTHEQGAWLTPTYSGGDYSGNGALTWTVDSGDRTSDAYWLRGRTLTWVAEYVTTSTGGTANTQLRRALPFTPAKTGVPGVVRYIDHGGAAGLGISVVIASSAFLLFEKNDLSNWSNAGANDTQIEATSSFEVT